MTRALVVLGALLLGSPFHPLPTSLQAPTAATMLPTDAEIQKLLAARVDTERRNVGIVVGIATPAGRRILSHGRASLGDTRRLDGDTVFEIGSVTKIFTSVLLADMVRRGEAKLTDSVFSYLPPLTARAHESRTITLVDLATHTSGLPLWPSNIPATRDGALAMATYTQAELLGYLSTFAIPQAVGQTWNYSNVDAGVLGLALGLRANRSYEALLQARVTGPLGMRSTGVAVSDSMRSHLPVGYDTALRAAPAWNVPSLAGAGSLHASANDLLAFLEAVGREQGPLAGVLPIMLAVRRPGPGISQALGWWIVSPGPQEGGILVHDGGTLGFSSAVAYDPKARVGIVVLSNTANGVGDLARHILRPSIPLTLPPGGAPTKTEITMDPATFDRLTGQYEPAPGIAFDVSRESDTLMIQLPGIPPLRLRPESVRTFFVAGNTRITVTFDLDANGRATALTLSAPTGLTQATRRGER